ncbi:hypothetical protein Taro_031343 [Colocasia esculenta]|uniref:Uncharacterized protein n=1 Tax=Colocasia esculenta TaxID=4460 RepID=A0A843VPS7_COLES|nr:hypothetical protein [Colocasia esculenta]
MWWRHSFPTHALPLVVAYVCDSLVEALPVEVCPSVGTVVVVVSEWRFTGCGLLRVVCPLLAHVLRFCHGGMPCAGTVVFVVSVVVPTGSRCLRMFSGLSGLVVWARSTRWFTGCERDGGVRRVQVVTALVVVFRLPLFGGLRLHGCHVSRTGQSADVDCGKVTVATEVHVAFPTTGCLKTGLAEQSCGKLCSARRGWGLLRRLSRVIWRSGAVFGVFSPRGHRAERGKRREFVFFMEVGRSHLV